MGLVSRIDGIATYFGRVWRLRYFWLSLVQSDLRSRYRRSMIGIGMAPLLRMVEAKPVGGERKAVRRNGFGPRDRCAMRTATKDRRWPPALRQGRPARQSKGRNAP